ncbi:MAG TPA: GNAT family N-acetyltransferase [Methanomassiliicoccales archaeon]|nr:GNAT family N-acetyltransferase [Methanomassiliicoccales archaeon]
MRCRCMQRSDLPELVAMSRENMAAIILSSWGEEWKDERLMDLLLDQRVETTVLEGDDGIEAYYCVEDIDEYIFISSFQVRRDFHRKGLGTRMLDMIEERARRDGKAEVELCVQSTNEKAKEFYYYHGYDLMYRNGNNLIMRKKL